MFLNQQRGGKPPSLPTPSNVREKVRRGGRMGPRRGSSQLWIERIRPAAVFSLFGGRISPVSASGTRFLSHRPSFVKSKVTSHKSQERVRE